MIYDRVLKTEAHDRGSCHGSFAAHDRCQDKVNKGIQIFPTGNVFACYKIHLQKTSICQVFRKKYFVNLCLGIKI